MRLYSPGEIVKILKGVNARQILDLAEKGLIKPVKETTGAGSARLYDFQNIFEICICLALRAKLPGGGKTVENIKRILEFIRDETAKAQREKEAKLPSSYAKAKKMWDRLAVKEGYTPSQPPFIAPPFDLLHIAYDDYSNFSLTPVVLNKQAGALEAMLRMSKKYRPQNYCTYLLEVTSLWNYLDGIFD